MKSASALSRVAAKAEGHCLGQPAWHVGTDRGILESASKYYVRSTMCLFDYLLFPSWQSMGVSLGIYEGSNQSPCQAIECMEANKSFIDSDSNESRSACSFWRECFSSNDVASGKNAKGLCTVPWALKCLAGASRQS